MIVTLNVVAVVISEETGEVLADALSRVQGINLSVRRTEQGRPLSKIGEDELPDVIILELNGHEEEDIEDVEHILERTAGRVAVFGTYRKGDNAVMRRLMAAGVRNIYPQPIETQELVLDIIEVMSEKRSRTVQAQSKKGAVTAFMNAKGGSGATTIATNVAHTLAMKHDARVALVDLDIQFGCAAMILDLKSGADVTNALLQPDRIDPVFVQALMTKHESGLHVLAAPGDLSEVDSIQAGATSALLQAVISLYDFVIIDVPRVFLPWTIEALQLAHPVMLVSQNSLVTIRDTKLILERLPVMEIPAEHVEVVNNRAKARATSVDFKEMKKALKLDLLHRISNDYETAVKAQDRGVPLREVNRRSPLTQDVEHLADYLHAKHEGQPARGRGLFGRFFKKY
ncbi:MAG TPA: AAA family ATPase [Gammaproteobacteria bacterium]|nr:AAA family ATPase [Gammaproteobacteria bacterium]